MELEKNMYVRTKNGEIGKIGVIIDGLVFINTNQYYSTVLKASHNIIDILELGDVVELFMEKDIDKEDTNIFELVAITTDKKEIGVFNSDFQIEFFPIENLRRVLTKEQFESMSYEVSK